MVKKKSLKKLIREVSVYPKRRTPRKIKKKPHRAVQKNPRIRDPKEKEQTRLEAPA